VVSPIFFSRSRDAITYFAWLQCHRALSLQAQQAAPHAKAPRVPPEPVPQGPTEAGADEADPVIEAAKTKPKLVGSEESGADDAKEKEEKEEVEERDPRKKLKNQKKKEKAKEKKRKRTPTPVSSDADSSDATGSSSGKQKKKKKKRGGSKVAAKKSRGRSAKTKQAEDNAEIFKSKGSVVNLTDADTARRDRLMYIEKHHYLVTICMLSVASLPAGDRKAGQCREEDPHQVMKLVVCLNINPYHSSGDSGFNTNDYGTCISECLCFM
jgi:hypothetical protein